MAMTDDDQARRPSHAVILSPGRFLVDERLEGGPRWVIPDPLEAYGYRWYRIGGMADLLQREKG
jgi:hypothetical protein